MAVKSELLQKVITVTLSIRMISFVVPLSTAILTPLVKKVPVAAEVY